MPCRHNGRQRCAADQRCQQIGRAFQCGADQKTKQRHATHPRKVPRWPVDWGVLGNRRRNHRHHGGDEEARRCAQHRNTPHTGQHRQYQHQLAGDMADQPDEPDEQNAAAPDVVGDPPPKRCAHQHTGGVNATEQADVTGNFRSRRAWHQWAQPARQQRHQRAVASRNYKHGTGQPEQLERPQPGRLGWRLGCWLQAGHGDGCHCVHLHYFHHSKGVTPMPLVLRSTFRRQQRPFPSRRRPHWPLAAVPFVQNCPPAKSRQLNSENSFHCRSVTGSDATAYQCLCVNSVCAAPTAGLLAST